MRSHGEGSIYQAGNVWVGEILIGVDGNGRRIRKRVTGRTRKDVAGKLKTLRERAVTAEDMTLGAWITYYLEHIGPARLKATTLADYDKYLRRWVMPDRAAGVKLSKLEPHHLEAIYTRMRETVSPSTVHHMHRVLRVVLNHAVKRGHLAASPVGRTEAPPLKEKAPTVLTMDQAKAIVREIERREDKARWLIAVTLGLRQGEVLALGWEDVDLDTGVLTVQRSLYRVPWAHGCDGSCGKRAASCPHRAGGGRFFGDPKTEAGTRVVHLPRPVLDALTDHKRQQDLVRLQEGEAYQQYTDPAGVSVDLVFAQRTGKPLPEHQDWQSWKGLLEAAGAPNVRLHDARHLAATTMLLMGIEPRVIMSLMGWSQMALLERYGHVMEEMRADAARKLEGAFWGAEAPDPEPSNVVDLASRRRARGAS